MSVQTVPTTQPASYRSYLLRLWEEHGDPPGQGVWRCSLEDPLTGKRHGFASLATMLQWLEGELAGPAEPPAVPAEPGTSR